MIRFALEASVLVSLLAGGSLMACTHSESDSLLSTTQAQQMAMKALSTRLAVQPKAYHEAARDAIATEPLLVERLDQEDYYYIVPLTRQDLTTLLVLIDARDGRFKEMAYLQEPGPYPPVDGEEARRILLETLADERARELAAEATPRLVFQPSDQTQSPFEPLWSFDIGDATWYVDQSGDVHERIQEVKLKGGGPPGSSSTP